MKHGDALRETEAALTVGDVYFIDWDMQKNSDRWWHSLKTRILLPKFSSACINAEASQWSLVANKMT